VAWTPKTSPALNERAAKIKVVIMDVDGTITDGSVTLLSQPDGSAIEIKTFDAHDGQGMTLGRTAGLRMAVITGRESAALRRRMKEMGVEFVYEKQPQKIAAFEEILKKANVEEDEVAYLLGLPFMAHKGGTLAAARAGDGLLRGCRGGESSQ